MMAFHNAVFRVIPEEETLEDEEDRINSSITIWSRDISLLPDITHSRIHNYLVDSSVVVEDTSELRGAKKHKVLGYRLFKDGFVRKVVDKPNIRAEQLRFLVKCNVVASMKKLRYELYIHLCQSSGDLQYYFQI